MSLETRAEAAFPRKRETYSLYCRAISVVDVWIAKCPVSRMGSREHCPKRGGKLGRPWYCVFIFRKIYLYRYEIDKSLRYQALDKNEG
jgi:hypothetical protein